MEMKRTTNFRKAIIAIQAHLERLTKDNGHSVRVFRIEAQAAKGDVIVVLEAPEFWRNRKSFAYRADGSFSELSFWTYGQI